MLKDGVETISKKGIHYYNDGIKINPWLGNLFAPFYDFIMKISVFPQKFGGDSKKHYKILNNELQEIHGKYVLELGTGSGSSINFLPNDNKYFGIDVSVALLKKAVKKFRKADFKNAEFYLCGAEELPFKDNIFDVIICILSFNFFNDAKKVFQEIKRVAKIGANFICCVPVPERKKLGSTIGGTLYTEENYIKICSQYDLKFESISVKNGALLYYRVAII